MEGTWFSKKKKTAVIAVDLFSGHIFLHFPPHCSVLPWLGCGLATFLVLLVTVTAYTYAEVLIVTFLHFCQLTPQLGNGLKYFF